MRVRRGWDSEEEDPYSCSCSCSGMTRKRKPRQKIKGDNRMDCCLIYHEPGPIGLLHSFYSIGLSP